MELFVNDNKCTNVDHFGLQIQGSCENANCNQEYRRVCMKCILFHKLNDQDFKDNDIKFMDDLTNIFNMFKQENSQTLNNIYLQCNIQNTILLTEIINFINHWSLRQRRLMRIQVELQQFEKEQWSKLNIKDYFSDEKSRQGIYIYQQNIEDQLMKVQNMMDFYVKHLGSNSNEFEETFKMNHVENTIYNMFEHTLQSLQDYLNNTILRLFKNEQFEKIQEVDNKYVSIFEILLKQGYNLISDVPQKQFNQVLDQFSDKINEHQSYYLQAFSLVYSPDSQNHLDESLELITRSINLNQEYAKAQYLKGIIQFDKKQYDQSIETFKLCIQLDDKYLDAYNALGNSYRNSFRNSDRNSQRYLEAKNCYDQALQINPQFVKSIIGKADVLSAERQFKEANELYDKAIKLDPKNSKAYCAKGMTLHHMHQFQEAIDTYNLALNIIKRYSTQDQASKQLKMTHIYYNIGLSLYNLCKYAEAIDMFNMEIKIDPINVAAYDELGKSLYQLQKFEEALLIYDKIIQLAPNDMNGYIAKGELFLQMGKPQEAKKVLEQFIQIDPNNKIVQGRLQQI